MESKRKRKISAKSVEDEDEINSKLSKTTSKEIDEKLGKSSYAMCLLREKFFFFKFGLTVMNN